MLLLRDRLKIMKTKENKNIDIIKKTIIDVQNFPKPGIVFRDVTPLLHNPQKFAICINEMVKLLKNKKFDIVAGMESRGFWFGLPIAQKLGLGFVPIRKKNKLPREVISASYALEYGYDTLCIHKNDIKKGQNVLVVDDVIATGNTIIATKKMFNKIGANFTDCLVLAELQKMNGKQRVKKVGINLFSLIKM